ncbi:hypothetical protein [Companilactobacillus jidongensis]|uniref:hypothetical protein n=1 Tax=Companilactobacillus jidongensis TaxID=2486006 RepID=UPI00384FD59F
MSTRHAFTSKIIDPSKMELAKMIPIIFTIKDVTTSRPVVGYPFHFDVIRA